MSRIIWPLACVILVLGSVRADAAIISSDLDFDNPLPDLDSNQHPGS